MSALDQLSEGVFPGVSNEDRPSPLDFVAFLPWACGQLESQENVVVSRVTQADFTPLTPPRTKTKTKLNKSLADIPSEHMAPRVKSTMSPAVLDINAIKVTAVYQNEHLTQVKFEKNRTIPRILLKILGLIIKFHPHVNSITVNGGLDKYIVYELSKIVPVSLITDICLDGACVREANYHILLDNPGQLKQLSLSRCNIDDNTVATIAAKLIYPLPASSLLSILILSSNRITDVGAKYLAETLRSNRQLSYLNLANNMLTDDGAEAIFDSLLRFHLKLDEFIATKRRYTDFLKDKIEKITNLVEELKENDLNVEKMKSLGKRKGTKIEQPVVPKKGRKSIVQESTKPLPDCPNSEMDRMFYLKAEIMIEDTLGEFADPYNGVNTMKKNDLLYSKGNNTLCYLNLAYNNLNYPSLKKLLAVLEYQRFLGRKPIGLHQVSIEGNPVPTCYELIRIGNIFETESMPDRKSICKKRSTKTSIM